MPDGKEKSPVNIDVGARAEAKLEVKAEVPQRSTGRLVDAITDMLSPFSERRGLRGDQIRLQREEVAFEIAKQARSRLAIENTEISPVPNKVLIPLVEAASNEGVDDEYMQDLWANLLASAASKANVEPRFVGILRELHGQQAEIFEQLALNRADEFTRPIAQLEDAPSILDPALVRQMLTQFFREASKAPDAAEIYAIITDWIDRPGCAIVDIITHKNDEMWSLKDEGSQFSGSKNELKLEILSSLGLCRRVSEFYRSRFGFEVQFIYYHISELGVRFFMACKNLQPEEVPAEEEHGA